VKKPKVVWPEPTRRAFVTMLGAAAAALTLPRSEKRQAPPPPLPRWIGHI
jgi:hypothetical protein